MGNCKEMEELNVESNVLRGPIPWVIINMSSVKTLGFGENELTGSLPDKICQALGVLEGLYMSYNKLSGPIPSKWLQCKELQILLLRSLLVPLVLPSLLTLCFFIGFEFKKRFASSKCSMQGTVFTISDFY